MPQMSHTAAAADACRHLYRIDRKSTRLNSSHSQISYAVFCLKKKKKVKLPGAVDQRHAQHILNPFRYTNHHPSHITACGAIHHHIEICHTRAGTATAGTDHPQ